MAYYLQMDGVDDFLKTPSMTFNKIILDVKARAANSRIYLDARNGFGTGYLQKTGGGGDNWGTSISSVKVDGVAKSNGASFIPFDIRCAIEVNFSTTAADDVNIFSSSTNAAFVAGDIYSVQFYNGSSLVANYDMSLGNQVAGTVQDQSGNGNHATLTGGTWVDDSPVTPNKQHKSRFFGLIR